METTNLLSEINVTDTKSETTQIELLVRKLIATENDLVAAKATISKTEKNVTRLKKTVATLRSDQSLIKKRAEQQVSTAKRAANAYQRKAEQEELKFEQWRSKHKAELSDFLESIPKEDRNIGAVNELVASLRTQVDQTVLLNGVLQTRADAMQMEVRALKTVMKERGLNPHASDIQESMRLARTRHSE